MALFLIDVNLPYHFSLWKGEEFIHQRDIGDAWTDSQIWRFAEERELTIVTKDSDFSNRILLHEPPPKVIHIKFGNLKMREFHAYLNQVWDQICELSVAHKLVNVFSDRIEGIN